MVCSGSVVVCGAGRWWQCGASGGLVEWSGVACGHAANCQSAQASHRSVAWSWSPHTHTHTSYTHLTHTHTHLTHILHTHLHKCSAAAAGGDVNDTLPRVQAVTVKSS